MIKRVKLQKTIPLICSAFLLLGTVSCASINNPFWPKSELRITDVKSGTEGSFIGIEQSLQANAGSATGSVILYTFIEPVVTIANKALLPNVTFTKFQVAYTLSDGTKLPVKEFAINKSLEALVAAAAGPAVDPTVDIQFQIMSQDVDLRAVVFPGNNAPRVKDAVAEIILFGNDTNGYEHEIDFKVPLSFNSLAFPDSGSIPVATPSPSAAPATVTP